VRPGVSYIDQNIEVRWVGWRSSLFELQRNGWSILFSIDECRRNNHFRLRHDVLDLVAISDLYQIDYCNAQQPPIYVSWVSSIRNLNVTMTPDFTNCRSLDIDVSPETVYEKEITQWSGDPMTLFGIKQQEQVFIEQADLSVLDHLQAIKDKQADQQSEIRQRILLDADKGKRSVNSLELIHTA